MSSLLPVFATVEEFLHSLQCEHGLPNVRDQLRRLWTKYVRDLYSEEDDADDGESARKKIRSKALTVEVEIESDGWRMKLALATLQGPLAGRAQSAMSSLVVLYSAAKR